MSPENPTKSLEQMEKLSNKNPYNTLPEVKRPAGLPINALPGWESIPLHSKLPMIKCPKNQVIFTKNKIGRSFKSSQRDFDLGCFNIKMDYNPLHDPHLKRFYSNEKLLNRLRENGEITKNNDVICNLKEFNKHRLQLNETYVSLIRIKKNKLMEEHQDIRMILHAENIARREKELRNHKAQLKNQKHRSLKRAPKRKKLVNNRRSLEKTEHDHLKNLTSQDMQNALETAIDLENLQQLHPHDSDDYIFKAAKYICEDILAKFDKDLSEEKHIEAVISKRINRLFFNVKQYVLKRAIQIISSDRSGPEQKNVSFLSTKSKRYSLAKGVSFNSFSTLIGTGSYALNEGDIKFTAERAPTPAGSLTSVVIDNGDDDDDETIVKQRPSLYQLSRDERIFIDHLFIKFKRELIVGIGKQVLTAIECHRKNKILDVRKGLQDIDKQYLVKLMTRSILSYAINKSNFHSNAILCQYTLAGDIILFLQKDLLKPKRDPRVIVQPRSRCVSAFAPQFSAYCR